MTFDPKLAVQTAVYDALAASPLPGAVPVFQHVPDGQKPPFVMIGAISLVPMGGKGGGLDEATIEILSEHVGAGREFLTPLMAEVRARIEDQALTATGASLSPPAFVSDDDNLLDDAITYWGLQRFSLFVQPSD